MTGQELKQAVCAMVGEAYYTEHALDSLSLEALCLLAMEHSFLNTDREDMAAQATVRQAAIALRARSSRSLVETVERKSQELFQVLARSISHDFRPPLRAAHGFTRFIAEDPNLSEESVRLIQRAITACDALTSFAEGCLTLIRSHCYSLNLTETTLKALLDPVLSRGNDHLAVSFRDASDGSVLDQRIWLDVPLMARTIDEIVNNAKLATARSDTPMLQVNLTQSGRRITLEFVDNGVGIPDLCLGQNLLAVGSGVHRKEVFPSYGHYGLAIAELVATRHGGGVNIQSPGENQGATVHLWFDVNPAESPL